MASIISAGTSSGTALNLTGDTSGILQLASNNGTVALTIGTNQAVSFVADATINGLTVGLGGGAITSNTVVGAGGALSANSTGTDLTAFGRAALSSNTASFNSAFGRSALQNNTSGANNTAFFNFG